MRATARGTCAVLAAALLSACSSGSSEPRAKFREPVFTVVDAADLPGVERLAELLAGDLNRDGKPDALVGYCNPVAGRFSYAAYLGNGDGSFRPAVQLDDLFDARLADFNGDGRLDLAGCYRGLRVLLGGGDGSTWTAVMLPPSPSSCEETAVGDFDGDGRADFAFGMRGAGSGLTRFAVLHGFGDGTFRPLGPLQNIDGLPDDQPGFFRLLPGRFNADPRVDLAVFFSTSTEGYVPEVRLSQPPPPPLVLTLIGRGDGTFGMPAWTWPSEGFSSAGVGDVDRDGRLDLVLWKSLPAPAQLHVAFGRGDGTFLDPSFISAPAAHAAGISTLVDLNGDGRLDVLSLGAGLAALLAEIPQ